MAARLGGDEFTLILENIRSDADAARVAQRLLAAGAKPYEINGRTVHSDALNGDSVLTQNAAMVAGQYWLLPILWVKGGVGLAGLEQDNRYVTYDYGTGVAFMGAAGVELLSARFFAIDLQARIIDGVYNSGNGNITAGTIGLGFNWY